jgi:hypothetical protein
MDRQRPKTINGKKKYTFSVTAKLGLLPKAKPLNLYLTTWQHDQIYTNKTGIGGTFVRKSRCRR